MRFKEATEVASRSLYLKIQSRARWVAHYNRGRLHSALGPGVPDPRKFDRALITAAIEDDITSEQRFTCTV